jgi:pyruvoyl-dependent arginine decarboxylase (PvlArgDC)
MGEIVADTSLLQTYSDKDGKVIRHAFYSLNDSICYVCPSKKNHTGWMIERHDFSDLQALTHEIAGKLVRIPSYRDLEKELAEKTAENLSPENPDWKKLIFLKSRSDNLYF